MKTGKLGRANKKGAGAMPLRLVIITWKPLAVPALLQRGPAIVLLLVIGSGGAAQSRTVVFRVLNFVAILNRRQPRLHVLEFGGVLDVFLPGRQQVPDLLLRHLDPVRRLRVRAEGLGKEARFLLLLRLQLFEEGNERLRVIACLVQIGRASCRER